MTAHDVARLAVIAAVQRVAKGESPLLDVLANDNIIPASGNDLIITGIILDPIRGVSADAKPEALGQACDRRSGC